MANFNNIALETIAALTNLGDCRIVAGLKDGELKSVINCGKMYETRWTLSEASEEIQKAVKDIVSEVGVCTIEVSWWTDYGYDGSCDISIMKSGTDIARMCFDPDGRIYDYLTKEEVEASRWPISWDAINLWMELGYSVEHYIHRSECRQKGWWTIQYVDPDDETLYEVDLLNNRIRHRGQELGCFWTEWEER